jgi:MoaA/NifB/PqqE/SkfB family radical SAM enzyme
VLIDAIAAAAAQGYKVVSISGGEPLLYPALPSLLLEARRQGLYTAITTNGLLLDDQRIQMLTGFADLLAISLDGAPERHNYMRNAPHAFEMLRERLVSLRNSGIPFGFLFTVTRDNLSDLTWAAEFASSEGAHLLQIHLLEKTGRASSALPDQAPTDVDATIVWLLAQRLNERFGTRLKIHIDLLNRDFLRSFSRSPSPQANGGRCTVSSQLADFISPLVVESDGTVVPLQYGFPRKYALGNLNDSSLQQMADCWLAKSRTVWEAFHKRVMDFLCQSAELPFVNWYQSAVTIASER